MEKEFVTFEIALEMFNIGFDEKCVKFQWIDKDKSQWMGETNCPSKLHRQKFWKENEDVYTISIPTFSQCFRWFRERKILGQVLPIDDWDNWTFSIFEEDAMTAFYLSHSDFSEYPTFEEAQIDCIKKMIEKFKEQIKKMIEKFKEQNQK